MSELQFLIFLIVGLAILIVILMLALFCRDKPCIGGPWKTGLSWTHGHYEIKPLHEWAKQHAETFYHSGTDIAVIPEYWTPWVSGGLFFYVKSFLGITMYIGMRPTAPDPPGVPIEPWPGFFSRWLKRHGLGNFGIALRRAK